MSLLDRFRQPAWKSPDAAVRLEAVRHLGHGQAELLAEIARGDLDPHVRRAAVHRLTDIAALREIARSDADEGVKAAATEGLVRLALTVRDAAEGRAALEGVTQSQDLVELARAARHADVRLGAVERLDTPRALALVARGAGDAAVRLAALQRLQDPAALAELALKCEHKDVAVAAVERLAERSALEAVAEHGRHKAAARLAQARLAERFGASAGASAVPAASTVAPSAEVDPAEEARYEAARAALEEDAQRKVEAVAARTTLCESVDALDGSESPAGLDAARQRWEALAPLPGAEGDALARRFEEAVEAARRRHDEWNDARARRERLEALCGDLEAAVELPELAEAQARVAELHKVWTGLGSTEGMDPRVQERYATSVARLEARQSEAREARQRAERDNLTRLQDLCRRLETLAAAEAPGLRDAERALRESRVALEDAGPLASKRDRDALTARLKAGRAALFPKVQELRESDEWIRWANAGIQEELCVQVEKLLDVTDLPRAARELRDIDERWKAARQAPKDEGETLWRRFKAARDQVRARCDAYFAGEAHKRADNLRRKEALCTEAESLAESTDWVKTAQRLQAMQEEWKAIGPVPRQKARQLWDRFRGACGKFFERRKEDRARRSGERKGNLEKKDALCVQAEALAGSTDWDKALSEVKRLQAEWKTVGPVAKDKSDVVWQRFRTACDLVFDRYRRRGEIESSAQVAAREALSADVEALAAAEGPEGIAERLRTLQSAWKSAGPVPRGSEALDQRFRDAVQRVLAAHPTAFQGTDLDPEANRKKMEKLCADVEALAGENPLQQGGSPAELLARRLREALAANTMRGKPDDQARKRAAREKVDAAQAAWSRLGPVPGEAGEALRRRFQQACRNALA
jgi:hypothetical protein